MQTLLVVIAFYLVPRLLHGDALHAAHHHALIVPIIVSLGFDPVWFGILMMVMLETALITRRSGSTSTSCRECAAGAR